MTPNILAIITLSLCACLALTAIISYFVREKKIGEIDPDVTSVIRHRQYTKIIDKYSRVIQLPILVFLLVFVLGMTICITCSKTADRVNLVSKKTDTVVGFIDSKVRLWKWDKRIRGNKLVSYKSTTYYIGTFLGPQAITENSKVRRIVFYVKYEFGSTPERGAHFYRKTGQGTPATYRGKNHSYDHGDRAIVASKTRWILHEFGEKYSKELSSFYNPEEDSQQLEFEMLLKKFAQPFLDEFGGSIQVARFGVL